MVSVSYITQIQPPALRSARPPLPPFTNTHPRGAIHARSLLRGPPFPARRVRGSRLVQRIGIPSLHVCPVDDVPDGLEVVRPHVLVLQVVCVLPHIDAQQRHEILHHRCQILRLKLPTGEATET